MYYVPLANLIGEVKRENGCMPIVLKYTEATPDVSCFIKDGKIQVESLPGSVNLLNVSGEPENFVAYAKVKDNRKVEECIDSSDNPIFAVLTTGIRFFDKVRTHIRYIRVTMDVMLVALIYGACEFECSDGSFVPLQRLNTSNLENKGTKYLSTSSMYEFTTLNKGGVDRSWSCINSVAVTYDSTGFSCRAYTNESTVLDEVALNKEKDRVAEVLHAYQAALDAEKLAKKERQERWAKEQEERRKAEELAAIEAAKEKAEKAKQRSSGRKKKVDIEIAGVSDNQGRNAGAASFLAYLQNHTV